MVEIRQARAGDWPAIARFVGQTYGPLARFKHKARWDWQMGDAPYPLASAENPPSWIALDGGEVVGQISLQPTRLHLPQTAIDAGWIVDVMVAPAMRGRGLGQQIYDAILGSGHTLITLTMAQATRRIARRAGCITLPPVGQFLRPQGISARTLRHFIEASAAHGGKGRHLALLAKGPMAGMAALGLRTGQAGLHLLRSGTTASQGAQVAQIAACDLQEVDALFARMADKPIAMFDRSAHFWRWRFNDVPDLAYRFARASRDGEVKGLAAWREPEACEYPIGTLTEVLAPRDDAQTLNALIAHATRAMAGCEAIIAGAADPLVASALRRAGFVQVKTHHPTVSSKNDDVLAQISAHHGPWHMSKADHDWDQIHAIA